MQIWVEDSGIGLELWRFVNKYYFNNLVILISTNGNNGMIKRLENFNSLDCCVLLVDKMMDNQDTKNTYKEIQTLQNRVNNVYLVPYGCSERIFLTFKEFKNLVKLYERQNILRLYDIIMGNSKECGIINKSVLKSDCVQKFCTNSVKQNNDDSYTSESIYKALLSKCTQNTFASIAGGKLGECWCTSCCKDITKKTCEFDILYKSKDKLLWLVTQTELQLVLDRLFNVLSYYLKLYYKGGTDDIYYYQTLKFSTDLHLKRVQVLKLVNFVEKYIKAHKYWNYKRIVKGGFKL